MLDYLSSSWWQELKSLSADNQPFHFIGIAGIGMSAIASILAIRGYSVSGSDQKKSPLLSKLIAEGATIFSEQVAENIKTIYSC